MKNLLSCIALLAIGCVTAGCSITQEMWSDASARAFEVDGLEGVILDRSGRPLALAMRYGTPYGNWRYVRIPVNEDLSPIESLNGRAWTEPPTADEVQLRRFATMAINVHRRAVPAKGYRFAESPYQRMTRLELPTGEEVVVFGYSGDLASWDERDDLYPRAWIELDWDPSSHPDPDYYVVVPAELPRSNVARAGSMAGAALLTPFTVAYEGAFVAWWYLVVVPASAVISVINPDYELEWP